MKGKLKIGLIVDGPHLAKYVYDLIEWSRNTDSVQISHLVVQDRAVETAPWRTRIAKFLRKRPAALAQIVLWKLKERLESRRLTRIKAFRGYDQTYDGRLLVPGEIHVKPLLSPSGYVYRYSEEDVARIRGEGFDLPMPAGEARSCGGGPDSRTRWATFSPTRS